MTPDQEAKYRLLDRWCDEHNKPLVQSKNSGDYYCKQCLAEYEKKMIDFDNMLFSNSVIPKLCEKPYQKEQEPEPEDLVIKLKDCLKEKYDNRGGQIDVYSKKRFP